MKGNLFFGHLKRFLLLCSCAQLLAENFQFSFRYVRKIIQLVIELVDCINLWFSVSFNAPTDAWWIGRNLHWTKREVWPTKKDFSRYQFTLMTQQFRAQLMCNCDLFLFQPKITATQIKEKIHRSRISPTATFFVANQAKTAFRSLSLAINYSSSIFYYFALKSNDNHVR